MITLIFALYPEAKSFIQTLHLKKNASETHYQLYEGEDLHLLITGAGLINAAACVARHFSLHPSTPSDFIINIGTAGYVPMDVTTTFSDSSVQPGDLFLITKITEQMTGRTFYPDILYRNPFRKLSLTTVATPATNASLFPAGSLVDMEASALYQALLPFFSPDRMFFLKIVSDILSFSDNRVSPENITAILSSHTDDILLFSRQLAQHLASHTAGITYTDEEQALMEYLYEKLPLTESTKKEVLRLFRYTKLTGGSLSSVLKDFLDSFPETPVRGKKQASPYLERLRELVLTQSVPNTSLETDDCGHTSSFYLPFFHTVYVEKNCMDNIKTKQLHPSGQVIEINHYKDIFNRSHQNFAEQKKAPALVLAKKTGTLIYEGAPVCQSFGNEHFYYTSCMMNCIYHCDYCYLQGMYPSGHVVVFINLEDYFKELEVLLKQHPVYLCISYDTDLLALEKRFGFVKQWLAFAAIHPELTLEIRTKSGNPAIFQELATIYDTCTASYAECELVFDKKSAMERIIFAWTVSPDEIITLAEHGTAPLALRLQALSAAKASGFSVRLCFDPIIYHTDWKNRYKELIKFTFNKISPKDLYDISIGVFRISAEYLKIMRKKRPDCAIVQFPYVTENGVAHYGTLSEEMVHYVQDLLLPYLPAEKIFVWNGGD